MSFKYCCFTVTPDELAEITEDFTLFEFAVHVPVNAARRQNRRFIESYRRLYELLCSGERPEQKKHGDLLSCMALTREPASLMFGSRHLYEGQPYEMYIGGAVPYLGPFTLMLYNENGRLCAGTKASYLAYTENIAGLRLVFDEGEGNETAHRDFTLMKDRLASFKPLWVTVGGVRKRMPVRVSETAKKAMNNFWTFKNGGIEVCR